jgi:tetratricopeptide (TPR) repeat protein
VQGDFEQALRHCTECLRGNPDHCGAVLSMGQIHEARGDIPAARAAYGRAIAADPRFGLPYDHLDRLLTRHASSGERVDTWRRIVGEHPDIGHPRVCLVRALHEGGRADDARREADECSARSVALPAELTEALGLTPDAGPQLPH